MDATRRIRKPGAPPSHAHEAARSYDRRSARRAIREQLEEEKR